MQLILSKWHLYIVIDFRLIYPSPRPDESMVLDEKKVEKKRLVFMRRRSTTVFCFSQWTGDTHELAAGIISGIGVCRRASLQLR